LAAAGRFDSAYRMLLCTQAPSWLYQIQQGATTMWERWDAILPDGSIHPGTMASHEDDRSAEEGHMLSFNHYAYGAVIDWVYRHLAGVAPVRSDPGYRSVRFAPRPVRGIEWAKATIEGPYGPIAIDWRIESGDLVADGELPPGTSGIFEAPVMPASSVSADGQRSPSTRVTLGSGTHRLVVTNPAIVHVG